jgi:CubicO group peptidase (beta-lactamase class C family)
LGWRFCWPGQPSTFGDLLGRNVYGHWGATGTMMWIDPTGGIFTILFSTEPFENSGKLLVRLSNIISGAWR